MADTILQMRHITKTFPGVKALDDVSLDVRAGEVLALCGENGAGKSTLMKVLTGIYKPDVNPDTQIIVEGTPVQINNPLHARALGINIIYQELATIWNLTVAQNIFLSREPLKNGLLDQHKMNEEAERLLDMLKIKIDVRKKISELSVGQQQMVEIAKAISYDSKILVMDEPSASLSYNETETLLRLIQELREKGISIIYISHRLDEVFKIADRITVLRDGKATCTVNACEVDQEFLVQKMVDRDLNQLYVKTDNYTQDEVVMRVEKLGMANGGFVQNINFELHKGEILGVSGLVGAGRTEIMELIFGARPSVGSVYIEDNPVKIKQPSDAIEAGIGFVTENRKEEGLVMLMNVMENSSLASLESLSNRGFINFKKEGNLCLDYIQRLKIKTPGPKQLVSNLSGGNQQKVVIAKWLAKNPKVLIVDEPTRGIDIGAKAEVHAVLQSLAEAGMGIIVVSSELPEILAVSDRILVVSNGSITGEFTREEATQEKILACSVNVY